MARGRPTYSQVRQNLVEILSIVEKGYGYDLYKIYKEIYPEITLRLLYYHLKKGVSLGEFIVENIKKEQGDYSWGSEVEKIYYILGPNSQPKGDTRIKKYLKNNK
jgi:hypothetical protein